MTREGSRPDELELGEEPELLPEVEEGLFQALAAAWQPREIDPAVNEALIAAALEDPLAPATEDELVASERLRRALEGEGDDPDAELARALRHASAPKALDELSRERVLRKSLGGGARARRGAVIYVGFGAVAAIATLAAALLLFLKPALDHGGAGALARDLALSRSTAALFKSPDDFDGPATTSRVDRIASSRARELRQNRYAMWGVR